MTNREELAALTAAVHRTVAEKRSRYLSGKRTSPASKKNAERLTSLPPAAAAPKNVLDAFVDDPSLSKADRLVRLKNHIGDCQRCPLGASRIQLAFGVGNPDAKVVFIDEGGTVIKDLIYLFSSC
jgi:DNA polymerase